MDSNLPTSASTRRSGRVERDRAAAFAGAPTRYFTGSALVNPTAALPSTRALVGLWAVIAVLGSLAGLATWALLPADLAGVAGGWLVLTVVSLLVGGFFGCLFMADCDGDEAAALVATAVISVIPFAATVWVDSPSTWGIAWAGYGASVLLAAGLAAGMSVGGFHLLRTCHHARLVRRATALTRRATERLQQFQDALRRMDEALVVIEGSPRDACARDAALRGFVSELSQLQLLANEFIARLGVAETAEPDQAEEARMQAELLWEQFTCLSDKIQGDLDAAIAAARSLESDAAERTAQLDEIKALEARRAKRERNAQILAKPLPVVEVASVSETRTEIEDIAASRRGNWRRLQQELARDV